jgi:transcriptional regulator with XRE-family HTH domain
MANPGKNRKNQLHQRLDRRRQVAQLYSRGLSQVEIAERLGVSQPTVSNDLKVLRAEWLPSALTDFNQAKAQELAKIDNLEREAWTAWQRSCGPLEVRHQRTEETRPLLLKMGGGKGKRGKRKQVKAEQDRLRLVKRIIDTTVKGQAGDMRFLRLVGHCITARLRILMPAKLELSVPTLDWSTFVGQLPTERPDLLEEAVKGIPQLPPPADPHRHRNGQH